ncbi:hypothetical protein RhiirA5_425641 [Rhizophagus irregularis]|uniref:Uncharacterized protein n=1 Tax=Rhizophagus irregularis TaxID=588596 RepID=A0A2N0QXX6_9GLOM|nr:hypothetical protein RhiirA5_425641 [Rhizophagus irregularis]PKC55881.1 hypothetical protein RhiirA1_474861 [Rhizophagus irregularis]CAB4489668.1 unnamed protein product [Rhizophagus irregularis]CAB5186446.1 unnamed protein product [Rhizophagus irregularis]CAB5368718.1 unnamed protein product [Rhizophagus irregularis]
MIIHIENLKHICYKCRENVNLFYIEDMIWHNKCKCCKQYTIIFKDTKIPNSQDERAWKKFYLNYEKNELQSEEKLKIILNRLKQECHKKDAFKYLKDWYNYSETKLIFLNYLEYHPRLCILLIEAGYVITGEMFLLTLKADIYDDRHIDDYFEVINAILKKLNLESNNRKKKDKFGFVGGEKSLRSESLSQCITNLTLVDHYKQTYLHYFIYEMSNRVNYYSNTFFTDPLLNCKRYYDENISSVRSRIVKYTKTCKIINEYIFSYFNSHIIARIVTIKNTINETAITLVNIFKQNLKDIEMNLIKFERFELLSIIVDFQNVVVEMIELFEKSIKQQKKVSNRKIKRNIEVKSINLEETVEDLKECSNI